MAVFGMLRRCLLLPSSEQIKVCHDVAFNLKFAGIYIFPVLHVSDTRGDSQESNRRV
jgi:hypothetical protein